MNQRDRLLNTQRAVDVEVAIEVEVDDAELVRASARKAVRDAIYPPLR